MPDGTSERDEPEAAVANVDAGTDAAESAAEGRQPLSKRAQKKAVRRAAHKEMMKRKKMEHKEAEKAFKRQKREEEQAKWEAMTEEEREEIKRKASEHHRQRREAEKADSDARAAAAAVLTAGDAPGGSSNAALPSTIVIDLSFDELMNEREIASLAQQVNYSYSANRKAQFPVRLALTSLGGATEAKLTSGHENWPVLHESRSYLDVFPDRERLVYLSSESDVALDELQPGTAYVVGGLVDHNRHKGLTHRQCTEAGVRTARLPIDEHLQCSQRRVLAVNHVVEILVLRASGLSWPAALAKVMPERRHAALREAEDGGMDGGGGGSGADGTEGGRGEGTAESRAPSTAVESR